MVERLASSELPKKQDLAIVNVIQFITALGGLGINGLHAQRAVDMEREAASAIFSLSLLLPVLLSYGSSDLAAWHWANRLWLVRQISYMLFTGSRNTSKRAALLNYQWPSYADV
jgi:hypothetical protein